MTARRERERDEHMRQKHYVSVYVSKQCRWCSRDYLYPFYGGRAVCNDCKWTGLDRTRRSMRWGCVPIGTMQLENRNARQTDRGVDRPSDATLVEEDQDGLGRD